MLKKNLVISFLVVVTFCFMGIRPANAVILFSDNFDTGLDTSVWEVENHRGAYWYHNPNGYISVQQVGGNPAGLSHRNTDIWTKRNDFSNFTLTYDIRFNNENVHNVFRFAYLRGSVYDVPTGAETDGYYINSALSYGWTS